MPRAVCAEVVWSLQGNSHPLITWLAPEAAKPHQFGLSQRHLINIKKDAFIALITYKIPVVLGALCPEQGGEPNTYFLLGVLGITPYLVRTLEGLRVTNTNEKTKTKSTGRALPLIPLSSSSPGGQGSVYSAY